MIGFFRRTARTQSGREVLAMLATMLVIDIVEAIFVTRNDGTKTLIVAAVGCAVGYYTSRFLIPRWKREMAEKRDKEE